MGTLHDVVVMGAGPAGLAGAVALLDRGLDVQVLEAAPAAGGHLVADHVEGHVLPRGPQAFLGRARHVLALLERLGLAADVRRAAGSGTRFILRDGRLVALPSGPLTFLTSPLLSLRGRLRVLLEPLVPRPRSARPHESVSDFFSRRIGSEAARVLAGTFVSGVHAGDPDALEARSAFPRLARWEDESGSLVVGALRDRLRARQGAAPGPAQMRGLLSLTGGLGRIAEAAAAVLTGRLSPGTPVVSVRPDGRTWRISTPRSELRARAVLLAVPPPVLARCTLDSLPELASVAGGIPLAPLAVVHMAGPLGEARAPQGYGVLVPRDEGLAVLGTLFTSVSFPFLAPAGSAHFTSLLGGATNPQLLERLDDAALAELAVRETRRVLGMQPPTGTVRVVRHALGIPQYVSGHAERVAAARTLAAGQPGLALAGNWMDGVSLDDAVASGLRAADALVAHLALQQGLAA